MLVIFRKLGRKITCMELEDKKFVINKRQDLGRLYDFILTNNSQYDGIILIIDIFLYPRDILMITQFVIHCSIKKCASFLRIDSTNQAIQKYIKDIGLLDFCDKNRRESRTIEFISSRTAMPIRRVTRETMDEYINSAARYFQEKCPTKELTMLNQSFAELINNVYDHAQSEIDAYVFCQYYPQKETIKIAVADLGIGITESVQRYHRKQGLDIPDEISSVTWAIKERSTTQSLPRNKGLGLSHIFTFIETNSSEISLFTGNVLLLGNRFGKKTYLNGIKPFLGTVIEVELVIPNLPDIEDGFVEFEF